MDLAEHLVGSADVGAIRAAAQDATQIRGPSRLLDAQVWWVLGDHRDDSPDIAEVARTEGVPAALDRFMGRGWRAGDAFAQGAIPPVTRSLDVLRRLAQQHLPGVRGLQLIEFDNPEAGAQAELLDELITAATLEGAYLSVILLAIATGIEAARENSGGEEK